MKSVFQGYQLGRNICKSRPLLNNLCQRCFGQPAAQTHPHLLQQGEVTPGVTQEEYQKRRYRLMGHIARSESGINEANHIVIIPSAPKVFMTEDIPYPFRQNTDFLYLCGFQEPSSVLILHSKPSSPLPDHKAVLFVPKRDPHKEMWDGARSGVEGATELTGVDSAYNTDELEDYFASSLQEYSSLVVWYDAKKPAHLEFHLRFMIEFLKNDTVKYLENARNIIHHLRIIKSPSEVQLMEKTCSIGSEAMTEVIKYSHPEVNEAHLYAKMDFESRVRGAECLAYPPVVAGGNRANTIHYVANNQFISEGEMVLMDAGCECHGYSSDVTRTWPVSGHFSGHQRELYEAVLEVQKECIKLSGKPDMTLEILFTNMLSLIGKQLQRLHIIPASETGTSLKRMARKYCPHHVGHYLGMDVHDTDGMSRSLRLQPGMIITIEPGVYIPRFILDTPAEFRGQGIRIEDDVLIEESGSRVLTSGCPKEPDDIERLVGQNVDH